MAAHRKVSAESPHPRPRLATAKQFRRAPAGSIKIAAIDRPAHLPRSHLVPPPTQESVSVAARQPTLAATTAAVSALVAANPALAGDLFGAEYSGLVGGFTLGIVGGTGAVAALLLPIICGTLNLLKWGEVIVIAQALIVVIDAQAQLDHA